MCNPPALRVAALFLALTACFLCPQAGARAGSITFDDVSENVTVLDTTGRVTSSACSNEHCFTAFSAPLDTVNFSAGPTGINVRESAGGPISDVLILNYSLSGVMIEFVSDVDGIILDPVPGVFVVETGTVQNVAGVTWTLGDGNTVVDTIGFISDVSEVPEPRGIALLGIGLIGLALIRKHSLRGEIGGIGNGRELWHGIRRSVFP